MKKSEGLVRKFNVLLEGPVTIIDVLNRLPDGILKDIPFSKRDLAKAATDRFFVKVKKGPLQSSFQ